jgi:hypothetical protein
VNDCVKLQCRNLPNTLKVRASFGEIRGCGVVVAQ